MTLFYDDVYARAESKIHLLR